MSFLDFKKKQSKNFNKQRDNYNLLIKNKNQIVEQNHDINDREKIQVDLFREIKKKKYSSFNNNHNNNNNNGSGLKKGDESQISNFSNCQVPKEKLSDQHSSFQRGYNSSSKLREMQTRTQSSTFYNNWHTNTKVKDYSQIQNNNLGSVNEKAKENLRELSSINLNETAFRSKEVQQRNQFNSLSPHSLQQHLKKGTIMNVIKQCQSTQNINQKHITEFTKEIRNKLQNKNLSRKELSQKYLKKQNRISFISQIDFNNILNDNSSITQQEIANQLPQFSSNQQQSEFPNLNQDRQSFQQDNNDNIDNSKFYQTQYKNYSTINQDSFQINDSFSSSMGNGFRYNKEFNRSRMGKQRITLSPQNQKNENQSKDFSQNNFHCSQIRGLNSRQSSTEKSILNPHSSAQNYTFETIVNNNEKKMKDLSKEKRSSLNLDQYKSMTQKEQQHQSQSYNKILNSKIQFKNNNFNIMTDSQQFKQAHKVNQNSLSALNDDLKLSKQQNQFSYNPFQHSDQKKNVFSLNGIDKNIIKTFKLDKIIQNDYEKSFIKLAQTCSQHIKEIKQIDKFQINSNSVKQNHTQIQSAIVRNRHNQRLVDLCNLKKRINMSTIQKESNINNTNINNSVNEQNSRKKLDGYYSEQQQPDQSKLDISLLQNLHIQQAQIQKNKPS